MATRSLVAPVRYSDYFSRVHLPVCSQVYLLDGGGNVKFTSALSEEETEWQEGDELPAYLAFCPSGDIRSVRDTIGDSQGTSDNHG